jgi:hypothetical protein
MKLCVLMGRSRESEWDDRLFIYVLDESPPFPFRSSPATSPRMVGMYGTEHIMTGGLLREGEGNENGCCLVCTTCAAGTSAHFHAPGGGEMTCQQRH